MFFLISVDITTRCDTRPLAHLSKRSKGLLKLDFVMSVYDSRQLLKAHF